MPPAYWEITNNEKYVGCSIHMITELLDEGDILLEDRIKIERWSTPKGVQVQLDELGVKLMAKAVIDFLEGNCTFRKQLGEGKTHTKPTLKQNRDLLRRIACANNESSVKKLLKNAIFWGYSHVYAPVRSYVKGFLGKQDIIILLYHRVNDFQRDSLTVGVEQFDKQMNYINRRFPVASLKALITGEVSRYEKKPIIIVSFDDGYLDNYDNAFPICVKNHIPCSFFVSTDMINSGNPFPHDSKLDIKLNNMTWSQLKEMKHSGMYIGSHTCDHLDCAKASKTELKRQFFQSQRELDNNLGDDLAILAYPFGSKHHFSNAAKEIARNEGYSAILSAYGGVNHDVDLYDIKRGGIDWKYSHQAFKARLFGWKQ